MKIAFLSVFYPFRGGIAQHNAHLFRIFEKEHDIQAFTFTRQYPKLLFPGTSQYVSLDDPADKIPAKRVLDTVNPLSYIKTADLIKKFKPDLFLTSYWMPFFAPSFGWIAGSVKKAGSLNISLLDNVIPHERRPGDIPLTKYFLNRNDGFIVMSNIVKDELLSLKPDADYRFHPHAIYDHFGLKMDNDAARERLGIPAGKKVLLFFGFIRAYKGLDIMLEALRDLPEDYILLIAGETYGSFEEYDRFISDNNLSQRIIKHIRYISDAEVPLFFSAADVCMLPYKSATQSGILAVTYHFEIPVIATDVGGLKESIEPYNTGIVIPEPSPRLLRDAILKYFNNDLKAEFAANIKNFKNKWTWKSMAEMIIKFYEELREK